jgi:CMP-N-acetylneuraminic acid synthetase
MAMNGLSVLAVVPARGGSKGIPRKNLERVAGYSLVARAAMVARQLPWLDAAVLSTDDEEIAEEGRRYGISVPILRPADLASDTATGVAAWRHAWLASERHFDRQFDCSVLLQPTSP